MPPASRCPRSQAPCPGSLTVRGPALRGVALLPAGDLLAVFGDLTTWTLSLALAGSGPPGSSGPHPVIRSNGWGEGHSSFRTAPVGGQQTEDKSLKGPGSASEAWRAMRSLCRVPGAAPDMGHTHACVWRRGHSALLRGGVRPGHPAGGRPFPATCRGDPSTPASARRGPTCSAFRAASVPGALPGLGSCGRRKESLTPRAQVTDDALWAREQAPNGDRGSGYLLL